MSEPIEHRDEALKARLPAGPWQSEPDVVEWTHEDVSCLIVRQGMGYLCGYVGVPASHQWHGSAARASFDAPREITYSKSRKPVPPGGVDSTLYWIGFSCGHYGDGIPRDECRPWEYLDMQLVRFWVEKMARAAAEASNA